MLIRGLKAALNSNGKYGYKDPELFVDYLIVGAGAVGLAVARNLAKRYPVKTTYVVERNASFGEETSSRNSEVVHAGLYYPSGSLKESLCIRGRHLLYNYCEASSIPYRKTKKLVVATKEQEPYIQSLHEKASEITRLSSSTTQPPGAVPTTFISGSEARSLEPHLSPSITEALLSHETGIIDSHAYMQSLEREVTESDNGEIVYSTSAVRVDPHNDGWTIQLRTEDSTSCDSILAGTLINCSGLSGPLILNSLLPKENRIPMYYAKGSYAAYNGPGIDKVSHLIYPCPDVTNKEKHGFQSLGTHLTLDLSGNVRFGPDIRWLTPPGSNNKGGDSFEEFSFNQEDVDFWKQELVADDSQLTEMGHAVLRYLPNIDPTKLRPDYCGIRPKLVPPWGGFQDFVIRQDISSRFLPDKGMKRQYGGRMISLLGIESPGLTASLAIAEKVESLLGVPLESSP